MMRNRLQASMTAALRRHLFGNAPLRIPEAGRVLWNIFADLSATRSTGFAAQPIGYADIMAYSRLNRWPLEPRHVDLICALDRVWLEWARSRAPIGDTPVRTAPPPPSQDMTIAAFDAVFG